MNDAVREQLDILMGSLTDEHLKEHVQIALDALNAAPSGPALDVTRVRDVRLLMIDGIGADLSREFAQGDPFEPFDRTYVVKTISRVLDAARDRARTAAGLREGSAET